MRPHQEETELVDLDAGSEKKEVKVGTGMTPPPAHPRGISGPAKGLPRRLCLVVPRHAWFKP